MILKLKLKKTPEEIIEENHHFLVSNLAEELLEKILQQSPQFFEKLVIDLLEKMGYGEGKITGKSGDGGIDGIIYEDKLGLEKVHIQAKRWSPEKKVRSSELRDFIGAIDGFHGKKGVFITTSDFTQDAYAHTPTNINIVRINGKQLAELMIKYNVGISPKIVYEIKRIDLDYFEED